MSENNISIVLTKSAIKDIYKKSEGKIGNIISIINKYKNEGRKFVYKTNYRLIVLLIILMVVIGVSILLPDPDYKNQKTVQIVKLEQNYKNFHTKKVHKNKDFPLYKKCYYFDLTKPVFTINIKEEKELNNKKKYIVFFGNFYTLKRARKQKMYIKKRIPRNFVIIRNTKRYYAVVLLYNDYEKAYRDYIIFRKKYKVRNIYLPDKSSEVEIIE